jgi:putative SbcD/Mre11-related phosphoesterase
MSRRPDWLLTPERAAVHLPTATAVIADLHLGYAQSRQRRGEATPPASLDQVLTPLTSLRQRLGIDRLVIAGDLFEEVIGELLVEELARWLTDAGYELVGVVPGNHDRGLTAAARLLPLAPDGVRLGDWHVVHGDGPRSGGRIVQGHVHPCLRWRGRIAAPCYLESADHLVLPAFSAEAAGVNVLRDPQWRSYRCQVIAGEEVLDFGEVGLLQV